ncbi:hypothetical protein L0B53_00275 [Vibrio sp. SS-MA-C1-2]|uniref:TrbI/VirB10 family protein n=1 Tax=Vibrio sp. SS-MA-C1-2 TaxID=2908646 RepID=UPI001F43BA2A|nr:TrbI/VirB10 family protein [Vibrio sp. SS-MA-C1-2]UJF17248.1 hypothetical protein L0B53_00275 [Vibrio sp. SS-MA-C1-2]
MNDKISPVTEHDRNTLNIDEKKSTHTKSKSLVIGLFTLIAFVVIIGVVFYLFTRTDDVVTKDIVTEANHTAGAEQSILRESNTYFTKLKAQREKEKAAEKLRKEKELAEANKKTKEREITNIDDKPQVQRSEIKESEPLPPLPPPPVVNRTPSPSSSTSSQSEVPMTPKERKKTGSVLVALDSASSEQASSPVINESNYNDTLTGSRYQAGSAFVRRSNNFLLLNGAVIPCAIYTQIISDYQGIVTCRVTQDVYSSNGASLLIEKGSLAIGEQKVAMEPGKTRIFTNWTTIETPMNISIQIDSLGTGRLGASGHDAWVDNHYAQRFGGAILLSFVDDALAKWSDQQSSEQYESSSDNANDMASKALDSSINIVPTGYSYIGQKINILVARNIDMSSVYRFQ